MSPNEDTQVPPGQQLLVDLTVAMGVLANNIHLLCKQQELVYAQQEKLFALLKKQVHAAQVTADINDSIASKLDTLDLAMEFLFKNGKGGPLSMRDLVNLYGEAAAQIEKENEEEEEEEEDP